MGSPQNPCGYLGRLVLPGSHCDGRSGKAEHNERGDDGRKAENWELAETERLVGIRQNEGEIERGEV